MMKALVFHGAFDVRLEDKPVPTLSSSTDAIIKTTSAALCGSELHRYRGHSLINMEPGYVCGHEAIGIVHEIGSDVKRFFVGDRVIVPIIVCCNKCFHCKRGVHGRCKEGVNFGNPKLDGSQAQYFRVPLADTTLYPSPVESGLGELAILMTDIFPTGYNGAKQAFIDTPPEEWSEMTIAVIGCGPVALCAIISALEYEPARIFAIDSIPNRLEAAADLGCIPLNFQETDVVSTIRAATDNNGVHAVIEGVGLSPALKTAVDIICPGGKISSFGVHNGELPFTAADCYNKNLHLRFGRCPLRVVFDEALALLIKKQDLVRRMNFIDVVIPALDESYADALAKFERAEVNKVVFKPNGPDL